jgi:site-specific recombinase XerC
MLEIAYYGGLRVSELVSLTWAQVIARDSGEAQLEIVGKGRKARQVLIPLPIATRLLESRGEAPANAPVFESVRNPGHALTERAVILRPRKRSVLCLRRHCTSKRRASVWSVQQSSS